MMRRVNPFFIFLSLVAGLALLPGCQRSRQTSSGETSPRQAVAVPPDLQEAIEKLTHAAEAFDIPQLLDAYAEDFLSGTGRSKDSVSEVFTRLQKNQVKLRVEKVEVEEIEGKEALLRTQLRLRYMDHFRDLGEGEVVITDVLRHALRKEDIGWKIYADERVFTYREGRFGSQPPNVQLDVPDHLPGDLNYPVTVTVRREKDTAYQVMVGNYAEDPAILPPPDIVTELPENGVLHANLLPNPQGRNEMVRLTVIATSLNGQWVGATTVSKFVRGAFRKKKANEQELV